MRNSLPRYAQIKEALRYEIAGQMHPGDLLPTESMLEQRFGVSRITIRRALDELESERLIVRQQGRGTFVCERPITTDLATLVSWTTTMRQMGFTPQTLTCTIERTTPPQEIRHLLQMEEAERAICIRRLRAANDVPICLMTNYLREQLLPTLTAVDLVDGSLFATLVAHEIHPVHAHDTVEARAATDWEAKQLDIPSGAPLLQVTRISFDEIGYPLVVDVVTNRADRYRYSITY